LLQLAVSSLGFTYTFGFGSIVFPQHFLALILQILLLGTYLSVFCMTAAFVQNRFACIALGMVYVFAEHILTEICLFGVHSNFLAGFLPSYYIFTLPENISSCIFLARTLLISLLIITASTAAGSFRSQKRQPKGSH